MPLDAKVSVQEPTKQDIYDQLLEYIDTKSEAIKVDIEKAVGVSESLVDDKKQQAVHRVVAAVEVRLLAMDFLNQPKSTDYSMLAHTFKITENTTFLQLAQAACDFWGLLEDNYQLHTEKDGKMESVSKDSQVHSFLEKRI